MVARCTAGPAPGVQLLFLARRTAAREQNSESERCGRKPGLNSSETSPAKERWRDLSHEKKPDATLRSQPPLSPQLRPSGHSWRRAHYLVL